MIYKRVEWRIGDNWLKIISSIYSNKTLNFYLNKFNINDYWIYKATRKQCEIPREEFYDFKYSGYIFFKKDKYDNNEINKSLNLIHKKLSFTYFNKPLPPLEIIEKIKVI